MDCFVDDACRHRGAMWRSFSETCRTAMSRYRQVALSISWSATGRALDRVGQRRSFCSRNAWIAVCPLGRENGRENGREKTRWVRVDGTRAEARGVRLHRVLFPLDRIDIFLIVEYLIFRKVCSRSREIDRDLGGAGLHSAYEAELETKLEF